MIYRLGFWLVGRSGQRSLSSVEFRNSKRNRFRSAFAGLSRKVVGSVRGMENKARTKTEIRDHIDQRVSHVTAWTTLLEALERKEDGLIEIPVSTLGEVARSIRGSVLDIQNLSDELATHPNSSS